MKIIRREWEVIGRNRQIFSCYTFKIFNNIKSFFLFHKLIFISFFFSQKLLWILITPKLFICQFSSYNYAICNKQKKDIKKFSKKLQGKIIEQNFLINIPKPVKILECSRNFCKIRTNSKNHSHQRKY